MNEKLTGTKKQSNNNLLKSKRKNKIHTHTRAKRNIIACCIQFVRHNIFVIDSAQFFLDHRFFPSYASPLSCSLAIIICHFAIDKTIEWSFAQNAYLCIHQAKPQLFRCKKSLYKTQLTELLIFNVCCTNVSDGNTNKKWAVEILFASYFVYIDRFCSSTHQVTVATCRFLFGNLLWTLAIVSIGVLSVWISFGLSLARKIIEWNYKNSGHLNMYFVLLKASVDRLTGEDSKTRT